MIRVLLDTDPGGDDALALLWLASLARQRHLELVAVTTVDGNVDPPRTYANAVGLLAMAGLGGIPVGRGKPCPAARPRAARVHGDDGLGGQSAVLPPPAVAYDQAPASARLIVDTLEQLPGQISLLAVGPLSNLAEAEALRPGILAQARQVVIMGGAIATGNVTPVAEFNIHFDPHGAARCLAARPDVVLIPLDLTLKLRLTADRIGEALLKARNAPLAGLIDGLCDFMIRSARSRQQPGPDGFPVHDAATVAWLVRPDTLRLTPGHLSVDTAEGPDSGRTRFTPTDGHSPATSRVAIDTEPGALLDALCADLGWLVNQAAH